MDILLEANEVSFSYQSKYQTVEALKKVSCAFSPGKCYAIVGKSGSGKTTLLSLLAGLELPSTGEVLFKGVSTKQLRRDAYRRDHCAVIYQSYNLFPLLTVMENAVYSMKIKGLPAGECRRRAGEVLASVGIKQEQFRRFPPQLSGGEQQRVAIARALAAGNELILADEPTGNLDAANSKQVIEILMSLAHEEGRCVIIITHDLETASLMDEVYVMRDGMLSLSENGETPFDKIN